MMPKLFTADQIFTGGRFQADHGLLVQDGRIEAAGPLADLSVPADAERVDLSGQALLPGTVSTHTHAFQYLLRGFGDDLPFLEWRAKGLYKYSLELGAEGLHVGALLCFGELLRHGCTTVVDFFYLNDQSNENADAVIRAAEALGIRIVLARCFYDFDEAPKSYRETVAQARDNFEALEKRYRDHPLVSVQPAPHSVHGASAEMIRAAVDVATRYDLPMHMHIAEEQYQIEECQRDHNTTPLRYVADLGVLDTRLVCVHGCWLDDDEITMLGEHRHTLAYNPSSNMFLADGVTPLPKMLRAGVNVTLGVDGGCSNNQASIFGEMRMCALLQKVDHLDATCITAEQAFEFGTRNARSALGLDVGSLEPGCYADFVALDLADLSLAPATHLLKNVVYAQSPRAIQQVWVGGKAVWRDDLLGVPEREVAARVADLTRTWT